VNPGDTIEFFMLSHYTSEGMWASGTNLRLGYTSVGTPTLFTDGFTNVTVNGKTGGDILLFLEEAENDALTRVYHVTATVATAGTIEFLYADNDANISTGSASYRNTNVEIFDFKIHYTTETLHWPLTNYAAGANQPEVNGDNQPDLIYREFLTSRFYKDMPIVYNSAPAPDKYTYVMHSTQTTPMTFGVPSPFGNGTAMQNVSNRYYTSFVNPDYSNGFTISYNVIFHNLSDRSSSGSGKRSAGLYSFSNSYSDSKWTLLADDFDGGNPRINFAILNPSLYRSPTDRASALNGEVRANTDVVLNTPYHVVGVARPDGTMELFVNGVSQGTSAFNTALLTNWNTTHKPTELYAGAPFHDGSRRVAQATMANIRFYEQALTPQEVDALYNSETQ